MTGLSPEGGFSTIQELTKVGTTFFFVASSGQGQDLWRTDATPEGTYLVRDLDLGQFGAATSLTSAAGKLYFSAGPSGGPWNLWKSDGTPEGTTSVSSFSDQGVGGSTVTGSTFAEVAGGIVFVADDGDTGQELWYSDGTTTGTRLVSNLNRSTDGSMTLGQKLAVGDYVFFEAVDGTGLNLWRTDGTEAGTIPLTGGDTQPYDFSIHFTDVDGGLYFVTEGQTFKRELWKSDGSVAGTKRVKRFEREVIQDPIRNLTALGGSLLFLAMDPALGLELWRSDGTDEGTTLVKDIRPGPQSAFSRETVSLTVGADGHVYFSADDGESGYELWVSDGTFEGTRRVADLRPGKPSAGAREIAAWRDRVYFLAYNG